MTLRPTYNDSTLFCDNQKIGDPYSKDHLNEFCKNQQVVAQWGVATRRSWNLGSTQGIFAVHQREASSRLIWPCV